VARNITLQVTQISGQVTQKVTQIRTDAKKLPSKNR